MADPLPGVKVKIKSDNNSFRYLNTLKNIINGSTNIKSVSNYEYEVEKNEEKRNITILKPEYLSVFLGDMKTIMRYSDSSDFIDNKTKKSYNPNINGV